MDLQFAVDEAVGRGGELLREPTDMGAGQFAVIRDPAGAVCALFQPAEPGEAAASSHQRASDRSPPKRGALNHLSEQ